MAGVPTVVEEMQELNFAYIRMAQQLISENKPAATRYLGMSERMADLLGNLSVAQAAKLARGSQMLCRFRFNDHAMLSALAEKGAANKLALALDTEGKEMRAVVEV